MEHKHNSKSKHTVSHPSRARAAKTLRHRKPLFGALALLVITAGFFVYMWNQMSSQIADQRDDDIQLVQNTEAKTPSAPDKPVAVRPQYNVAQLKVAGVAEEESRPDAPDSVQKTETDARPGATPVDVDEPPYQKTDHKLEQPAYTERKVVKRP